MQSESESERPCTENHNTIHTKLNVNVKSFPSLKAH